MRGMAAERVQSLERALDVLEAIGAAGELGVTELAARTALNTSTAHRLMATLAGRGYLSQEGGRYRLGPKLLELAGARDLRTASVRALARPHLERIRELTGESVNLVVLDGDRAIYVDQAEGTHSVRMFTEVGTSVAAHTSGAGKAILAHQPPDAVARLYPQSREPFDAPTPRTLRTLQALQDDFARIRRRGYALDNEEHELGVSCIATPILNDAGVALAAISISAPTARIAGTDRRGLAGILREHAGEISAVLTGEAAA
jgi:IclR family acetate operon transcriptional repressor